MADKETIPGLNILCIDGGGMRGLSALLLISEIMNRLEWMDTSETQLDPADYFDVIAGTGTGGISACMLGRLGLSMRQAILAYTKLAKKVFSPNGSNGIQLQEALKSMVRDATGNENERMKESEAQTKRCKTMVTAMSKHNMNAGIPTLFRSYRAAANPEPECTIWEALYATTAHPDLFESIEISDGLVEQYFVGGELGCSNPIAHVLGEVRRLYPGRHVSCVLSLGAGHPRTIQITDPSPSELLGTQALRTMKDMASDSERAAQEMAARFQHMSGVYYRLNVDQGMQDMKDDWEERNKVAAHTRAYMEMFEVKRMMGKATEAIQRRQNAISVVSIDGSIQPPSLEQAIGLKRCPAPTSVFTGRQDHIQLVGACIVPTAEERRVCVVYGLGGAGKTQLALKTIELNRDSWTHILYVDASSRETIETDLQEFAKAKGIGARHSDTLSWLGTCREPWLMLFDNADDPALNIHQCFPSCNRGSILITTRLPALAGHARGPDPVCHVSSMSPEDAHALLFKVARIQEQNVTEEESESANALLKDFGYLALAIVHAGTYIAQSPHITPSKYRELFLAQRRRMLEQYSHLKVKLDDYGKSVHTTWRMCYDQLGSDVDSQRMLWLMAYLHHEGIGEDIFRRASANILTYRPKLSETEVEKEACSYMRDFLSRFMEPNGRWDTLRFSEAISALACYSLVDFDEVNRTYSIHVLVQDWIRTVIPHGQDLALECTTILVSRSARGGDTANDHIFRRKLVMHVDEVLLWQDRKIGANHAASIAGVYSATGRWAQQEQAENILKEARENELGAEHPDTLTSMSDLASTYSNQGRWDKAESLQVQVLDARKRVLGEEHPDTLTSMNNLASTYWNQGRWGKAESLGMQVLDARKRVLGEEHPSTLTSMNNLASTYKNQGRWDKAESLQVQVLDARKRVLGEEHPDTLGSMNNLAYTYQDQGRWAEAEALRIEELEITRRKLGDQHTDTLNARRALEKLRSKRARTENSAHGASLT